MLYLYDIYIQNIIFNITLQSLTQQQCPWSISRFSDTSHPESSVQLHLSKDPAELSPISAHIARSHRKTLTCSHTPSLAFRILYILYEVTRSLLRRFARLARNCSCLSRGRPVSCARAVTPVSRVTVRGVCVIFLRSVGFLI